MKLPRRPRLNKRQKILTLVGIALLIGSLFFGILKFNDVFQDSDKPQDDSNNQPASDKTDDQQPVQEPDTTTPKQDPPAETPSTGPADEVGTLSWVVNKTRPLNPKTYTPSNLVFPGVKLRVPGNETMKVRGDVATAIEKLFTAAQGAGLDPMFSSGYRSYSYQSSLYGSYVSKSGQEAADTYSARAGYSEHQTGLAFDVCNAADCDLEDSFAGTALGQWIAAHAHEYGFTVRYKQGKENITGYSYEPWHLRYVGTDLASKLREKTMEEYFGLPAAPNYP